MHKVPVVLIAVCVAGVAAAPQERTAEIHGRTVDALTRQPVRGAVVGTGIPTAAGPEYPPGTQSLRTSGSLILTNADGRFVLRGLAAGSVTIAASKHGYFNGASGRRRPDGGAVPVVITAGDRLKDIDVLMWPMASVSGMVTDERGFPIAGVRVAVSRKLDDGAPRQIGAIVNSGMTDDTGRYTVGRLGTGEYIVGVVVDHRVQPVGLRMVTYSPNDVLTGSRITVSREGVPFFSNSPPHVLTGGRRFAYAGTFYGGVSDPSLSATIALRDGEERIGVDLRLEPQPTVRVAGTVTGNSGLVALATLQLSSGSVTASATSGADGSFVFENLPAGTYDLAASAPISNRPAPVAAGAPPLITAIAATRNVENLGVMLGAGPTVSGTVSGPADMTVTDVRVRLSQGGSTTFTAPITTSRGAFAITGVPPGRYIVSIESGAGVTLDTVELRGRNVTDVPFEVAVADVSGLVVHLATTPTVVSGTVQRQDGKPPVNAAVALFPVDSSAWGARLVPNPRQFQTKRVTGGGYFLENVPRGDYYLVAVDDALLRSWHDRALLQRLVSQAVRITVAPGTETRRDLTVEEK